MPDLETFEAEVKSKIKLLSSKNAGARLEAARWLGEAGDPSAITGLAQAYKNDPDARVREAARYSLGMFRALERAFDEDEDRVLKLLEAVALEGKMGGRSRLSKRGLIKVQLALVLSLVLLLIINVVGLPLLGKSGGATQTEITQVANAGDKDRATIVSELRGLYTLISNNTTKLQAQYQRVLGGSTIPCTEYFDDLQAIQPYTLSPNNARAYPELTPVADEVNAALTKLKEAKAPYDKVCDQGEALPASEVGAPMALVVQLVQSLPNLDQMLTAAAVPPTAAPTATTAATESAPTATITTTPTEAVGVRSHLSKLQTIIDDMTGLRGANTLLETYWSDSSNSGCREPVPAIPEDYPLLSPDEAKTSPDLELAIRFVNTGLGLVRQNWSRFQSACQTGSPIQQANEGLQFAKSAKDAFDQAAVLVNRMRAAP